MKKNIIEMLISMLQLLSNSLDLPLYLIQHLHPYLQYQEFQHIVKLDTLNYIQKKKHHISLLDQHNGQTVLNIEQNMEHKLLLKIPLLLIVHIQLDLIMIQHTKILLKKKLEKDKQYKMYKMKDKQKYPLTILM